MSQDRKPRQGKGRPQKRGAGQPRSGSRPTGASRGRPGGRDPRPSGRPAQPETQARTADQQIYDGPPIPDEVTADDLDRGVRRMLHGLPDKLADRIARHLVMAGLLIGSDPQTAHRHALAARARAARVAVVREACGETAYAAGEWSDALAEFRAAKRLGGSVAYTAMMADCLRALGKPDKAIALDTPAVREKLDEAGRVELSIVIAGARADQGQHEAALRVLERESLHAPSREPWVARLRYAYADRLLEAGRREEAVEWFHRAAAVDAHGITDAAQRVAELDG